MEVRMISGIVQGIVLMFVVGAVSFALMVLVG
jgi:hypothetical protein